MRLIDELNELYAHYLREINSAVARDDLAAAELLAQAYEDDAVQLMAEREGRTAMLPLHPPVSHPGALRRLVTRLRSGAAA